MFELINKYYDENYNLEKINRSLVLSNEYSYSSKENCHLWRLRTFDVNNDLFYYMKNENHRTTILHRIQKDSIEYVEVIYKLEQKEQTNIKRYVLKKINIELKDKGVCGGICLEI